MGRQTLAENRLDGLNKGELPEKIGNLNIYGSGKAHGVVWSVWVDRLVNQMYVRIGVDGKKPVWQMVEGYNLMPGGKNS